jgi:NAD(P)-dependent dehydrogenase (short-subunit alcohol dehydrogenase family)
MRFCYGRICSLTEAFRGACVARKFAQNYSVALLARKPANYEPVVKEIEAAGGKAIGISTDVADPASVKKAFEKLEEEMGGAQLAAAVFNVGGSFVKKPFLELTEEEFMVGMDANGYSQCSPLPLLP